MCDLPYDVGLDTIFFSAFNGNRALAVSSAPFYLQANHVFNSCAEPPWHTSFIPAVNSVTLAWILNATTGVSLVNYSPKIRKISPITFNEFKIHGWFTFLFKPHCKMIAGIGETTEEDRRRPKVKIYHGVFIALNVALCFTQSTFCRGTMSAVVDKYRLNLEYVYISASGSAKV